MTSTVLNASEAETILAFLRSLTARVGADMCALSDSLRTSTSKGGVDLVTRADTFSEDHITTALAKQFPEHRIAGEEGTRLGPADSPWTWHIDPLDGTANYSRGIPYWSISIGLAYGNTPVLGIVHGPACGVSVSAAVGHGAWNGERQLMPAGIAGDMKTWIVATDWPWALPERARTNRLIDHLAPRIRQYKTFGSAALDFAGVAMGTLDAYAISHIFPWDQCAGAAACAALGYELRRWDGSPWDLRHADVLACTPGMWEALRAGLT